MDVFDLRNSLVDDYGKYATSFVSIRDPRIKDLVDEELEAGLLWPQPLVQLNPAFEPGGTILELITQGLLDPGCDKIFRLKDRGPDGTVEDRGPLRLHRHQADAIRAAREDANYVLTTGTGSGKSLAYIIPIVDHVLRTGSGKGIKALIIYPMNALANSQLGELEKYINLGFPNEKGPVRFARYTGQETDEERTAIMANPPDILITNYMMMELILTRPHEKHLLDAAHGHLRYIVLDELHSYRGRQGADVAILARRIRTACASEGVRYVGTSATMAATGGSVMEQRAEVARVATELFGAPVKPQNVIGETLRRATAYEETSSQEFRAKLRARLLADDEPPEDYQSFIGDPLSVWIEDALGLAVERSSGTLVRRSPRTLEGPDGAAQELSRITDVSEEAAARAIRAQLLSGYTLRNSETGLPAFAFRLHQFISRGETVYATIDREQSRHLTTEAQRYVLGDRSQILFPLAFCRECGQEYYPVWLTAGSGPRSVEERDLFDLRSVGDVQPAFLAVDAAGELWPSDAGQIIERLPDDWIEMVKDKREVKRDARAKLPKQIFLDGRGKEDPAGVSAWLLTAPFRFCLRCGVAYTATQRSDFTKLATLGSGGRSTATTILSLSVVRGLLRDQSLPPKARKLLSFTDNRQDASLQAGHFNDFIQTSLLRSALFSALKIAGDKGIEHDVLAQKVFDALALPLELYGADPEVRYAAKEDTERALRSIIGYRLYRDLKRGWRVTSPNLEQCGLLAFTYRSLDELCATEEDWKQRHHALATASPETRVRISRVLLDYMRSELAIKVDYLDEEAQEAIKSQSFVRLRSPWALDEREDLETASVLLPRRERRGDPSTYSYLSPLGGFGRFLRRPGVLSQAGHPLSSAETETVILDLLGTLRVAGLVEPVVQAEGEGEVPGYQIPASALLWMEGDGLAGSLDPIRVPRPPEEGRRPNPFFGKFYATIAADAKGLMAGEHTAQVKPEIREERENEFRAARLPILFCSPTMELGVDIAELNVVNMRNVPPTPANYAQRSGRAGRSGQPALVFTYCTTGSPHDRYYFRQQRDMVAGQVMPPRIDLHNEDLVRAHVQAIWLAATGASLGSSLGDFLETEGDAPSLALRPEMLSQITDAGVAPRALERAQAVLAELGLAAGQVSWFDAGWLESVISSAPLTLDRACDRWRDLYRAATAQVDRQHRIIQNSASTEAERKSATRLRQQAEAQIALLQGRSQGKGDKVVESDFYSYRYLASEGFLPGYSFTRLPLSAFIPGSRRRSGDSEAISRPRFLAISEFGPRSLIYHEGSRYQVNRVLLPPDPAAGAAGDGVSTIDVKWCDSCGYVHPLTDASRPDLCERCGAQLPEPMKSLFHLRSVATRRRERISSDEEERQRQGYEIRTGIRFSQRHGGTDIRTASVDLAGKQLARLAYGDSADIWRVNLGWRRSSKSQSDREGFALDVERGTWAPNKADSTDQGEIIGPRTIYVRPFVQESKNALVMEFEDALDPGVFASFQAAMIRALGVVFQVEDRELAAEALPSRDDRRALLFYEAAEGGAGVLRRLVDDPGRLATVAAAAIELCHFDSATGEEAAIPDGRAPLCEAACYDCLMSYTNQMDHVMLDRKALLPLLKQLQSAHVSASPVAKSRQEHFRELERLADSQLEKDWLKLVLDGDYVLPSHAQLLIEECGVRPDFYYAKHLVTVFIDGPHHDADHQKMLDDQKRTRLEDAGYVVIVFGSDRLSWKTTLEQHHSIFGGRS